MLHAPNDATPNSVLLTNEGRPVGFLAPIGQREVTKFAVVVLAPV